MNKRNLGIFLALFCVFLVFAPALKNPFTTWDDFYQIVENLYIRSLSWEAVKGFFTQIILGTYVPLTTVSHALEYHFFKLNPFYYHLNNILLHLANVWMIYCVALRCGFSRRAALFSCLVFGLHPMHVEPVVWVTARKDLLYSFFYLIAIYAHLAYLDTRRKIFWGLSIFAGFFSILAKAMALSLPFILLLFDWFKKKKMARDDFFEKVPYFLYIIPVAWMTYQAYARIPGTTLTGSISTWLWCFAFYIRKFFWPYPLLPLYGMPQPLAMADYFGIWVVLTALVFTALFLRRQKVFSFAFLYYILSIFFLLRFDTRGDAQVVADRFMYLPSLGFCLLVGNLLERFMEAAHRYHKALGPGALVLVYAFFSLFAFLSLRQTHLWREDSLLWGWAVRHNPSALAYQKLGDYYYLQSLFPEALDSYGRSLDRDPFNYEVLTNVSNIQAEMKQYDAALETLGRILEIYPHYALAYINRSVIYGELRKHEAAIEDLNRAIHFAPSNFKAYVNRGINLFITEQIQPALDDFNMALSLNSYSDKAYFFRGLIYKGRGQLEKAEADFVRTLELNPNFHAADYELIQIKKLKPLIPQSKRFFRPAE